MIALCSDFITDNEMHCIVNMQPYMLTICINVVKVDNLRRAEWINYLCDSRSSSNQEH